MALISPSWPAISSGTLTASEFIDRSMVAAFAEVFHQTIVIHWTVDGTTAGADLFSSTVMPLVVVMIQPSGSERDWSHGFPGGPMLRPEHESGLVVFGWETSWNGTTWQTQIFRKGTTVDGDGQTDDRDFLAIAHAIGRGI